MLLIAICYMSNWTVVAYIYLFIPNGVSILFTKIVGIYLFKNIWLVNRHIYLLKSFDAYAETLDFWAYKFMARKCLIHDKYNYTRCTENYRRYHRIFDS